MRERLKHRSAGLSLATYDACLVSLQRRLLCHSSECIMTPTVCAVETHVTSIPHSTADHSRRNRGKNRKIPQKTGGGGEENERNPPKIMYHMKTLQNCGAITTSKRGKKGEKIEKNAVGCVPASKSSVCGTTKLARERRARDINLSLSHCRCQ